MAINIKQAKDQAENQDTEFTPVPEGRYILVVDNAEIGTSKAGNKKMTVRFSIADGKYKNRKIWRDFSFKENAQIFIYLLLKALESPLTEEDEIEEDKLVKDINGRKMSAFVNIRKQDNYPDRNEIDINSIKSMSDTPDELMEESVVTSKDDDDDVEFNYGANAEEEGSSLWK